MYKWVHSLEDSERYVLPRSVRDELLLAVFLMPFAEANLRSQVDPIVRATDASESRAGGVACFVPEPLREILFRMTEARGEYVRLDWGGWDEGDLPETKMRKPQGEINDLFAGLK